MKSIILIFSIIAMGFSVNAQYDHFSVRVDGLGCSFCAYGIESKFSEVEGIKDIEVDLSSGTVTYKVPAEMEMDYELVKKMVDEAGYTAISVAIERADGTSGEYKVKEASDEAKIKEASVKVYGNCGMCKDSIEKAALSVRGVESAKWDAESQTLEVTYNADRTDLNRVHRAVARVGHDTEEVTARDRVYNNLHECCKYERRD